MKLTRNFWVIIKNFDDEKVQAIGKVCGCAVEKNCNQEKREKWKEMIGIYSA